MLDLIAATGHICTFSSLFDRASTAATSKQLSALRYPCIVFVVRESSPAIEPMFSSPNFQNLALCKKKIPRHIKLAVHAWSTNVDKIKN